MPLLPSLKKVYDDDNSFEEYLPFIRGSLSKNSRKILEIDTSDEAKEIASSLEAALFQDPSFWHRVFLLTSL